MRAKAIEAPMALKLKRIYEPAAATDGMRVLVDRLWPRGMAKEKAKLDLWLKEIAPSDALRKRFHAKPEQWDAFLKAYFAELESGSADDAAKQLRGQARKGTVTLLYAAHDADHNNAVALKAWLTRKKRT
jgi:uncharacterized protein YeaO (DUF488 family)